MTTRTTTFAGAALVLLLAGCASDSDTSATTDVFDTTPIEDAKNTCAPTSDYVIVGDDGVTLTIDGEGDESAGASLVDIVCVLSDLGVSDAVVARMDSTRALDGVQTGEWDGYTASWSYHPDDGIDLIIEED